MTAANPLERLVEDWLALAVGPMDVPATSTPWSLSRRAGRANVGLASGFHAVVPWATLPGSQSFWRRSWSSRSRR